MPQRTHAHTPVVGSSGWHLRQGPRGGDVAMWFPMQEDTVVVTTPTRPPQVLAGPCICLSLDISQQETEETLLGPTLPSFYHGGQQSFEPKTKNKQKTEQQKTENQTNKLKLEKKNL